MYNVLVIEDEQLERDFIEKVLSDSNLNIDLIVTASNGYDAIFMYNTHKIDIAIVDINIPGRNGLEVIEIMKQQNQNTKYIILTAYDYFEYAQKAIHLGVTEFVLKPTTKQAIIDIIEASINELDSNQISLSEKESLQQKVNYVTPQFEKMSINAILTNSSKKEIRERFWVFNNDYCQGFCLVVMDSRLSFEMIAEIKGQIKNLNFSVISDVYVNEAVFVISSSSRIYEEDVRKIKDIFYNFISIESQIGIGCICQDVGDLSHSYQDALQSIARLKHNDNEIARSIEHIDLVIDHISTEIVDNFLHKNDQSNYEHIDYLAIRLVSIDETKLVSKLLYFKKVLNLKTIQRIKEYDTQISNGHGFGDVQRNYTDVVEAIKSIIKDAFDPVESYRNNNMFRLVNKAKIYMEKNYMKNIGLTDIADYLSVSVPYVSRIISSYSNTNFTDLLNKIRIDKAKELLRTDKQIKNIAHLIGYQSSTYFGRVFKKYVGLTPKEYKDKYISQ